MPVPSTGSKLARPAFWLAATCLSSVLLGQTAAAAEVSATSSITSSDATPAVPVPKRIISLDLCTDWILAHHADPDQVVAISPLQPRYRPEGLTHSWPHHDGTLERIIELKPDLILAGEYNAITLRNRLKTLGFRVEVLPLPTSLNAIRDYELKTLKLLGKSADRAHSGSIARSHSAQEKSNSNSNSNHVNDLHNEINSRNSLNSTAADNNPARNHQDTTTALEHKSSQFKPRLLLLGANGVGTGTNTFEHDVLTRAGWHNYLQAPGYQQLDLERMVTEPPEAVLWSSTSGNALANRFSEHPALRHSLPPDRWLTTDYWRWQCPGPWTWDLINDLRAWLR